MVEDWNPTPLSIPQVKHRAWNPTVAAPPADTTTGWAELKDGNASGAGSGAGALLINFVLAKLIGSATSAGLAAATVITVLNGTGSGSASPAIMNWMKARMKCWLIMLIRS